MNKIPKMLPWGLHIPVATSRMDENNSQQKQKEWSFPHHYILSIILSLKKSRTLSVKIPQKPNYPRNSQIFVIKSKKIPNPLQPSKDWFTPSARTYSCRSKSRCQVHVQLQVNFARSFSRFTGQMSSGYILPTCY